jgi:exosortase B
MSSTPYDLMQDQQSATPWRQWLPIALGLLLLFVPTYYDITREFWAYERGSHGPIILLIVAWLFWRDRSALIDHHDARPILGGALVGIALGFYILGRSQGVIQFEAGAQIPLLAGIVLCLCGTRAMRRLWFPILFLAFLVPLPGSLLDAVLLPLKQLVSQVVEQIMYSLGYPIARTGVVLIIGPYQLLIADACSGLNSMIALSGIGLLYVYIAGHSNRAHNLLLLASVLPIAFLANILRVLLLMFVTYYYGDGTGQAFHNQAGYLEIVFAFGAFFALDALLSAFFRYQKKRVAHA